MDASTLACKLEVSATGSKEFALAFDVSNPGAQTVAVDYFEPYLAFDLKAYADDGEVSLIQPAFDTGVQPVRTTIDAGKTVRITTPIRLQFDPDVRPSGGEDRALWTLRHRPAPVRLRVRMRLGGANVAPCEARLVPRV